MPLKRVGRKVAPVTPITPVSERQGRGGGDGEGVPHGPGSEEFKKTLKERLLREEQKDKDVEDHPSPAEIEPTLLLPSHVNSGVHANLEAGPKAYRDMVAALGKDKD